MADAKPAAPAPESQTTEHIVRDWAARYLGNSALSADVSLWKIVQDAIPALVEMIDEK